MLEGGKGGSRVVKGGAKFFLQVWIELKILHQRTKFQLPTPILG